MQNVKKMEVTRNKGQSQRSCLLQLLNDKDIVMVYSRNPQDSWNLVALSMKIIDKNGIKDQKWSDACHAFNHFGDNSTPFKNFLKYYLDISEGPTATKEFQDECEDVRKSYHVLLHYGCL